MGKFVLAFKRKGTVTPPLSDLVELGILPKQISEFTNSDIGTTVLIPYNDTSGKILLNSGCIEFEVVGVNHHTTTEYPQTITLMTKNIIRDAAFDAKEKNSPILPYRDSGNNRWSVSNIRQWLNSSGAANSWFKPQHEYDEAPTTDNIHVYGSADGAYAGDPGFLAGFSSDVLQHLTEITNTTALCTADGGGSETTVDKVFLPSYTEMGFGNNRGSNGEIAEGIQLPKFTDSASRWKGNEGDYYWLRSLHIDNDNIFPDDTRVVWDIQYGSTDYTDPDSGNAGIAPIIVLH